MNATNYAAAGHASLFFLEFNPMSELDNSELCRNPGKKLARMASGLSLAGKVALAKALVPIFHCARCF